MTKNRLFLNILAPLLCLAGCGSPHGNEGGKSGSAGVVNVYTARHYDTDMALYQRFTELTGIKVNLIEGDSDALIERMVSEGELSPADVFITVDAGRLWRAQEMGLFARIASATLESRVPAHLRDPDGRWFGLSRRARVVAYNASEGLPIEVRNYEDLADPRLRSRVCMRSSTNIYNLSLLASLVEHLGEQAAQEWAAGVAANFARPPQGNDTAQLRAVAAGECGVTVANTYYLGRLIGSDDPDDGAVTDALTVVFPNQDNRGTHVNISGAGVAVHAPNPGNAVAFVEYLTSDFAQRLFAEGNNEYPVIGPVSGPVSKLGEFREDRISASVFGANQARAVRIFDRAGWR